jgi:CO/xanthine dehydrogenase Mo-binding subunit/aerobic-type carbon monoxide dehydrogenase small subunit (CoxS/CutS family)
MPKEINVRFNLNGEDVEAQVGQDMTLLRYLRDVRRLKGTKNGCSTNHCGACTVLVDDHPTRSCLLNLAKIDGRRVETIEGLHGPEGLHPIQIAFLASGAVQCGFCTPGMIMATKGLLTRRPDPTDEEILEGLKNNICRCTGYVKIVDAVRLAARWVKHPEEALLNTGGIGLGRSLPDWDGRGKVDGSLPFAGDMELEGMIQGKVLWSAHPHAEILSVTTERAEAIPGVVAVLTGADVPGHNGMGSLNPDQPVLCKDRVRFLGDAIAVVFAESLAAAEQAVHLIEVEYGPLQGIFSPEEAMKVDAPRIHEQGNICKHLIHEEGDIGSAFTKAAAVVAGHFETPFVEHAYLEPEAGLAMPGEKGSLTIYAPTQFPFEMRRQLAAVVALPEEKVRVIATPLGGAFGSKLDNTVEALVTLGAHVLRRPVKITLSRAESIRLSTKRHPYKMDYRVAFDAEGRLLGVESRLLSDAGPYTTLSPRVIDQACLFSCGPYRVPNLKLEGWAVFTNNVNGSAFRGFGINQAAVAIESLMDEGARRLGLDPFEIRLRNALEVGDRTVSGEILKASVATRATIEAARDALARRMPEIASFRRAGKRIGIGVASGFKNVGAGKGKIDDAGAIFILQPDGRILLRASAVDMGQGIRTAMSQIASQVLGTSEERIDIITGDTELTIRHGGAVGERQILINGRAVEIGARQFQEALLKKAAELMGLPPEGLRLGDGVVLGPGDRPLMSLEELAARVDKAGEKIEISYYYVAPKTYALADKEARRIVPPEEYSNYPGYAYTTQIAVVEVEDSGKVKVLQIIAAHDCGRAINPQKIEGQIEGSCVMGMGYALSEAYVLKEGRPVTKLYGQLGVPKITETPDIEVILIEDPDPNGPFGAKGISEVATVPVTPAILNAIFDATGVRITSLPATPDKISGGLASSAKGSAS